MTAGEALPRLTHVMRGDGTDRLHMTGGQQREIFYQRESERGYQSQR